MGVKQVFKAVLQLCWLRNDDCDHKRADLGRPDLDVDAIARREWRSVFVNYRQRGMFSRIGLG